MASKPAVSRRVIHLHAAAPSKPALGQPCNGCGVCCALEPCPLGVLLSLRRHGRCRMLRWDDESLRYLCGALARARGAGPWAERLVVRWIAAGAGCDAEVDAAPAPD
jgi:hypothetical protein